MNELTTREEQPLAKNDIRTILQSDRVREQIEIALPKHMSPDRMMRVALTAINKNPKLLECTKESILLSLMTCSQYGVEPDGRNAHLIPYRVSKRVGDQWQSHMECQFQWDYKGLVAQIRKSPDVSDIYADIICENDVYKVTRGLHRDLIHEVDISKPRGAFIAAYSVCLFRDGTASFELVTADEIEGIRLRSKSTDSKTGKSSGAWETDYFEMAKKTAIKRHSKLLPLPTEIAAALAADNEFDQLPQASVTEVPIPRASIPAPANQQQLPAATQPPENREPEPKAEPKPAEAKTVTETPPPEKPRTRRLAPKPEAAQPQATPEPKADPLPPNAAELVAKLTAEGMTTQDLLKLAVEQNWIESTTDINTPIQSIDPEIIDVFLGDWETALDELKKAKASA